ncbi:MAG: glycosidase, partial [Bacilli bacterium]|nr:glycosidase [Bacilli bacterium]
MRKKLIIEPKDLHPTREDFEVIGVFNPGVIKYKNEYIMIARVAERVIQNDPGHYLVPLYVNG